jgi:aminoglycoside phosphotransferase (APT) family kinase protein
VSVRSGHATSAQTGEAKNLTVDTVVPYLLERGLVGAADIVEGDLEIVDVGRRNENLKVIRKRGMSYMLKQPGTGEPATDATIRCEAALYGYLEVARSAAPLQAFLPRFCGWDEDRCLLVLELVEGRPLWRHYAATEAPEFPADSAAPLGDALGTVHHFFRQVARAPDWMSELHAAPPWILSAHRPSPEVFSRLSPANLQLLSLLQKESALVSGLDSLQKEWTPDTLIHNDLKGDNVLVVPDGEDRPSVRIVDWELVQIGDAAWDVGAVFRDFLDYWLMSVPLSGDLSAEEMLDAAKIPLAQLHPAARAFWSGYCGAADIGRSSQGAFLLRSLRFAGARLAQGSYELSSGTANPSNFAIALLQLAANVMVNPQEASLTLFGIPVPWRTTT